jgi:hypothetical protein
MENVVVDPAEGAGTQAPATLPALLRMLGCGHATVPAQEAVVKAWLAENTPSRALRQSLRANGYGRLLTARRIGPITHPRPAQPRSL